MRAQSSRIAVDRHANEEHREGGIAHEPLNTLLKRFCDCLQEVTLTVGQIDRIGRNNSFPNKQNIGARFDHQRFLLSPA